MDQISRIRTEAVNKSSQITTAIQTAGSSAEVAKLQAQLEEVNVQAEKQVAKLSLKSALPIPDPPRARSFKGICPHCKKENTFEMADRAGETRKVFCGSCNHPFNAHVTSGHQVIIGVPRRIDWETGGVTERAKAALVSTQAWIPPSRLEALIPMVVQCDSEMKNSGLARSPFNLQLALLQKEQQLGAAGLGRGIVRKFLKLVYYGHGFKPPDGLKMTFSSAYVNDLEAKALLESYLRATMMRIIQFIHLKDGDSTEIAELLLGGRFGDSQELVKHNIAPYHKPAH
jgi:hypothetical protein